MANYSNYSKLQHKQIANFSELSEGEVFICRTESYDNPFEEWDYAVGVRCDDRSKAVGKFKDLKLAMLFAEAI